MKTDKRGAMNEIIDIHSHILPGIDDGSRSVEESLRLLAESARQGVCMIVATPHFYPTDTSLKDFLKKRKLAAEKLLKGLSSEMPEILLGAEVYYFDGISRAEGIEKLQIGESGFLLLEMPFEYWNERVVNEVISLKYEKNINIILAHIERYMQYHQKKSVWKELRNNGIYMQCNAEFFLNWKTKRKAARMLLNGEIDFLGSDCHNMTRRPPRLLEAYEMIDKMAGNKGREILKYNSQLVRVNHVRFEEDLQK